MHLVEGKKTTGPRTSPRTENVTVRQELTKFPHFGPVGAIGKLKEAGKILGQTCQRESEKERIIN